MSNLETLKAQNPIIESTAKYPPTAAGHSLPGTQAIAALVALVQQHEAELAKAQETIAELRAAQPLPGHPIPQDIADMLNRDEPWAPEEALRFYANGHHFDTVPSHGGEVAYTRILDVGSIASNALKGLSAEHLEMKGDAELTTLRSALAIAQAELEQARSSIATLRDSLQQQARELEEADEALIVATEVAQDMRGYCRGWDWKYGAEWDAALTASEQRMAAALARHSARAQQAEAKKEEPRG